MKKLHLKEAIPSLVRKHHTFSPSQLRSYILAEYNKDVTAEAITMYFKRHPEQEAQLRKEVTAEEVQTVEVTDNIFQNGTFQELPSIKKWNIEKATLVSPVYQRENVNCIKRVCQGIFYVRDRTTKKSVEMHVPNWTPKSPERLTLEQAQEFIAAVHNAHSGTKNYRIAVRDFFLSRDHITLKTTEVSGMMPPIGRWKHVYVPRETLDKIFAYVKARNYVAYVADLTMFKTGARSTACLTEFLHRKLRQEEGVIAVTDKGFHRTGRQTYDKLITTDLLGELEKCWSMNGDNPFASLDEQALRELNKEAYRQYLTGDALDLGLAEPNHFWRHQFGQHMLRATKYNYTVVAELGSWSNEAMLKKVYGAPPLEMLRKAGLTYIPQI